MDCVSARHSGRCAPGLPRSRLQAPDGPQVFDAAKMLKDDPSLVHGLSHFTSATVVGGGLPIIVDGEVVGGIGVGGASVEEDVACAQAGIDAL